MSARNCEVAYMPWFAPIPAARRYHRRVPSFKLDVTDHGIEHSIVTIIVTCESAWLTRSPSLPDDIHPQLLPSPNGLETCPASSAYSGFSLIGGGILTHS